MNLNVHLELLLKAFSSDTTVRSIWIYFSQYLHFIHIDPEKKQHKYFFFTVHASNIFKLRIFSTICTAHCLSIFLSVSGSPLNDWPNDYHEMIEKTHFNFIQDYIATLNWMRSMTIFNWVELTRKTVACNSAHLSKIKFRLSHDNLLHLANIINLMTLCLFSMFVLLSDSCLETYYCDTKGILHFQTIGNYTIGWQINKIFHCMITVQ